MTNTLVLVTGNANKVREFNALFQKELGESYRVISIKELGYDADVEENGATFEENALIKAKYAASLGYIGIADDSGLCVDYLDGAPGIYSARYSGQGNDANNEKLLYELSNAKDGERSAKFVCSIACAFPDGRSFTVTGECKGMIGHTLVGDNGFGYDPLFYYPPFDKTFAQMSEDEKNLISHRAVATSLFTQKIKNFLNQ